MHSWAWVSQCWYSVDAAAIFRVPVYKTGKDAYVSTAMEGEAVGLARTFIFRGSPRDLAGWIALTTPCVQGNA